MLLTTEDITVTLTQFKRGKKRKKKDNGHMNSTNLIKDKSASLGAR